MSKWKPEKPEGHTLYWVYAHTERDYNFETSASLVEARKSVRYFIEENYWKEIFIWWGNAAGAFTDMDYVEAWYKK